MVWTMQDYLATFQREWPVIKAAPWSFALCIALAGCLIAIAMRWFYSRTLAAKDAEIASKAGAIDLLTRERDHFKTKAVNNELALPEPVALPRTGSGRLEFVFGDAHPFSELAIDPEGRECRFVRVALLNTGDEHLDECQASIVQMTPGPERAAGAPFYPLALTADSFSLRPGARKFLDIAFHYERSTDGTADPRILIMAKRRTFAVTAAADRVHAMCLRAETADGMFTEATCRLFVEDGRLRLVRR